MEGDMGILQKLTKKFLFSLETGVYVASNSGNQTKDNRMVSVFHAYVPEPSEREDFWIQIKNAKADGRLCNIFKDKDEYFNNFENLMRSNKHR
jgi:hypothetical protein